MQHLPPLQRGGVARVNSIQSKALPSVPAQDHEGAARAETFPDSELIEIDDSDTDTLTEPREYQELSRREDSPGRDQEGPDANDRSRLSRYESSSGTYDTWRPGASYGIPHASADEIMFEEMCKMYAAADAIDEAAEQIRLISRRFDSQLISRQYYDRLGPSVIVAMCIKDELEAHELAQRFRKENFDIRYIKKWTSQKKPASGTSNR